MKQQLIGSILCAVALAVRAETPLNAGDAAPALKVGEWLKGAPVPALATGQVYVVEFWATWCGPCRMSIPHLTELAAKFEGKAQVIGVSVFERGDYTQRVATAREFVTSMGDQMKYTVATDSEDAFMAGNWMEASGQQGIPSAFIVDRRGRVVWIGNPWGGMDEALGKVVDGTYSDEDVRKLAAERTKEREDREREMALMKPVLELRNARKPAEAVAALDSMVAAHPEMKDKTAVLRFKMLLDYNPEGAVRQAQELLQGDAGRNPGFLYMAARDFLETGHAPSRNPALALELAQRACEISPAGHPSFLDFVSVLAEAHFACGHLAEAVTLAEDGIRARELSPDKDKDRSLEYAKRRLQTYQEAAARPAPAAEAPKAAAPAP